MSVFNPSLKQWGQCTAGQIVDSCWLFSHPAAFSFGIVQRPIRWCSLRRRSTGGLDCSFAQRSRHWPHHDGQSAAEAVRQWNFEQNLCGISKDVHCMYAMSVVLANMCQFYFIFYFMAGGIFLMANLWVMVRCAVDEHVFSTRGEGTVGVATRDLLRRQKSVALERQPLEHRCSTDAASSPMYKLHLSGESAWRRPIGFDERTRPRWKTSRNGGSEVARRKSVTKCTKAGCKSSRVKIKWLTHGVKLVSPLLASSIGKCLEKSAFETRYTLLGYRCSVSNRVNFYFIYFF